MNAVKVISAGFALGGVVFMAGRMSAPQNVAANAAVDPDCYVFAVSDNVAGLVPVECPSGDATATPWPTPSPIIARTLTTVPTETATPTRTSTATATRTPSATPTKFTPSPSPTLPPYPYYLDIVPDGARYRVLTTTLRIRSDPNTEGLIVGQYTQNQMPLIRCVFYRSGSELWASEQTCNSPNKYWAAIQIINTVYMEIVQD